MCIASYVNVLTHYTSKDRYQAYLKIESKHDTAIDQTRLKLSTLATPFRGADSDKREKGTWRPIWVI